MHEYDGPPVNWLAGRHIQRERYIRFLDTELGKLYGAYSKAIIDYWRQDGGQTDTTKLKALNAVYWETQQAFVAKLMEIAGV
jgi:hypothetical protein